MNRRRKSPLPLSKIKSSKGFFMTDLLFFKRNILGFLQTKIFKVDLPKEKLSCL